MAINNKPTKKQRANHADLVLRLRLAQAGIINLVKYEIVPDVNERNQKISVIQATYQAGASTLTVSEDIDRFFCPEMFAKSITRRAAYIKAGKAAQIKANEAGIHPDMYQAA